MAAEQSEKKPVTFYPIGLIRSPYTEPSGTPIQPVGARGREGMVEVFPEFSEGLSDLEGFSHIILLYHCHLCPDFKLKVVPFADDRSRGLFATRAPARPNPLGLSIVRLSRIEGRRLYILDVDVVDKTPLLDIKPHVEAFHVQEGGQRFGWLESRLAEMADKRDDGRFG